MNKSNSFKIIYPYIFSIALVFTIIIASIFIVCFIKPDMLYNLVTKLDTPKYLPFETTDSDINLICTELMQYLAQKIKFLETKININGILTDFYSIRTKVHMGDVRNLFGISLYAMYIAIIVCIFSLFKIKTYYNESLSTLKAVWFKVLKYFSIIFIIIVGCAIVNFDNFFIAFHKLLFTNDYWLLDPNEDYIICLLPENLFMIIGIRISVAILIFVLLVSLLIHLLTKTQPRQEAK